MKKLRMTKRITVFTLLSLAFIALAAGTSAIKIAQADTINNGSFSEIGVHPEASNQTTIRGKSIHDMAIQDGKLYTGYGDYDENTGPIQLIPFDLQSQTFENSAVEIPTEEASNFRTINGKLYLPWADPQAPWTSNVGYTSNESGTWQNYEEVLGVHLFDMASLDGSDLWIVGAGIEPDGSTDRGATAYRSTDNQMTWNIARSQLSTPTTTELERYYWIASLNGKIYMQAKHLTPSAKVQIFDGTSWTEGTENQVCDTTRPNRVTVFNNRILCPGAGTTLNSYDGTTLTSSRSNVGEIQDFYQDGSWLYTIGAGGVMRTSNGTDWNVITSILTLPQDARGDGNISIAVHDDLIYIGSTNSKIFKSDQTISDMTYVPETTSTNKLTLSINDATKTYVVDGSNFDPSGMVKVGDVVVSPSYNSTNTQMSFGVPASSSAKTVDITITNSNNQSAVIPNAITYFASSDEYEWSPVVGAVDPKLINVQLAASASGSRIVVNDRNYIYLSVDSGDSFKPATKTCASGCSINMSADGSKVLSLDGGYSVLTSNDGGVSWNSHPELGRKTTTAMSRDGMSMYAYDRNGDKSLHRSLDGGINWQRINTPSGDAVSISSSVDGKSIVMTAGSQFIYVSTDYGSTWSMKSLGAGNSSGYIQSGKSLISNDGQTVVISNTFSVLKSIDGGFTWTQLNQTNGLGTVWYGVSGSLDGGDLYSIDMDVQNKPIIRKSSNEGATWQSISVDENQPIGTNELITSTAGGTLLTGYGQATKSIDNGKTWQRLPIFTPYNTALKTGLSDDGKDLFAITSTRIDLYNDYGRNAVEDRTPNQAPDDTEWKTGYASKDLKKLIVIGDSPDAAENYISSNGGVTWSPLSLEGDDGYKVIEVVGSLDGTILYAQLTNSGASSALYRSNNGGANWQKVSDYPYGEYKLNVSQNGKTVALTGTNYESFTYQLFVSDDYGQTLQDKAGNMSSELIIPLRSAVNNSTIISGALSLEGGNLVSALYASYDKGQTWTRTLTLPQNDFPSSVELSRNGVIQAVSSYQGVLVSKDKGATWQYEGSSALPTSAFLTMTTSGSHILSNSYDQFMALGTFKFPIDESEDETIPTPPEVPQGSSSTSGSSNILNSSPRSRSASTTTQATDTNTNQALQSESLPTIVNLDSIDDFSDGKTVDITFGRSTTILFKVGTQIYRFNLADIISGKVTLKIQPGDDVTLLEGKEIQLDLNGDGKKDISMRLKKVLGESATVSFTKLTSKNDAKSHDSGSVSTASIMPILFGGGVIVLLLLAGYVALKKAKS